MVAVALMLVVLAVGFGLIERRWPSVRRAHGRRGTLTDVIYWITSPVISQVTAVIAFVIIIGCLAVIAGTPGSWLALAERATWFSAQPLAIQIALVLVVGDFTGYWIHRAFHRGRLWRFHAIHHSSKDLDWLSAVRVHPVNDIVQRVLQAIPLLALGFDPRVVAAYVPAIALYGVLLHANVSWRFGPLRYVIASPAFHRWHHTSEDAGLDKNFGGLFPIWDLMFGTFHLPPQPPRVFGVHDDVPDGFVGQLTWPFRRPTTVRRPATRVTSYPDRG